MTRALFLFCLLACVGCTLAAVFSARAGRGATTHDEYRTLLVEEGDAASCELLLNVALTGLDRDDVREIDILAERLAARGGPEWFGRRELLLAATSWRRSLHAEMLSDRPEGGLPELDDALAEASAAVTSWRRAFMRDASLESARRNVERGLARVAMLEAKHERLRNAAKSGSDGAGPTSEETLPDDGSGNEADPELDEGGNLNAADGALSSMSAGEAGELTPEEVLDLESKLENKREEKRAARRARLRERRRGGAAW